MLVSAILAIATQFLPTPSVNRGAPLPYPHPSSSCYGVYQRMTNDAEGRRRRDDYAGASKIASASSAQIVRCLAASATPADRKHYRYSLGRSLWIAGEYAYAAGDRTRACDLVARGHRELIERLRGESRPKIVEIIGDWIHQGRRDLRGNWSSWEVAGGLRALRHPDRPCAQNPPNNPTDPTPLIHEK